MGSGLCKDYTSDVKSAKFHKTTHTYKLFVIADIPYHKFYKKILLSSGYKVSKWINIKDGKCGDIDIRNDEILTYSSDTIRKQLHHVLGYGHIIECNTADGNIKFDLVDHINQQDRITIKIKIPVIDGKFYISEASYMKGMSIIPFCDCNHVIWIFEDINSNINISIITYLDTKYSAFVELLGIQNMSNI